MLISVSFWAVIKFAGSFLSGDSCYTLRGLILCKTKNTLQLPSSHSFFTSDATLFYSYGPVGGIITDMHFICRSIVRFCGRISPLLSRDISVLARRYLCLGPKISPPVGFMPQLIPPTGINYKNNKPIGRVKYALT